MVKHFFFFAVALLTYSNSIFAQDRCLEVYDREAIYLRTDFWTGTRYVKNGQSRNLGIFYKHLNREFDKAPAAVPLFLKAKRNAKIATIVNIATTVTGIIGGVTAYQAINQDGFISNQTQYNQGMSLLLGSAVVSLAVNIPLQTRSRQQLDDAIWLRNRSILGE